MINLNKSKKLLLVSLSFILGIWIANYFYLSPFILYCLILGSILFIMVNRRGRFLWLLISFLAILSGAIRFNFSGVDKNDQAKIWFYNDREPVEFIGLVADNVNRDINSSKIVMVAREVSLKNKKIVVHGQVLIKAGLYPDYAYGDLLQIKCGLKTPGVIVGDDGRNFDYGDYLSRYNIYSVCYRPEIKKLSIGEGNVLLSFLFKLKNSLVYSINQTLHEPYSGLLAGILLGIKSGIDPRLLSAFSNTGTTHIIALSGYNITIIITALTAILVRLAVSRKKSFYLLISAVILFVLMTGAEASIVRAAVMGSLTLLASHYGRLSKITNVLVVSAVLMLLVNSRILVADIGFQLSFLATGGLVYFSPALVKYLKVIPEKFGLRESIATTLSATIFTLPITIYYFGKISLVSLAVNILILPMVPLVMLFGFIGGMAGIIFVPLGRVINYLTFVGLWLMVKIVELWGSLPLAAVKVSRVSQLAVILMYAGLIFFIWKEQRKKL